MRFLGIDYGHKRVGLAISDPTNTFARELDIIDNNSCLISNIQKVVKTNHVQKIVVGMPMTSSRLENKQTQQVKTFIQDLQKKVACSVTEFDERYTSMMAKKYVKSDIDSLAAVFILQGFLESNEL